MSLKNVIYSGAIPYEHPLKNGDCMGYAVTEETNGFAVWVRFFEFECDPLAALVEYVTPDRGRDSAIEQAVQATMRAREKAGL
jgi:hypothetical protein